MPKHQTFLRCSRKSATIVILLITSLFLFIGCAALFRSAGLSDDQAAAQTAALKGAVRAAASAAIADVQTGPAEGHDLKTIAARASSAFLWKILTAGTSAAGVILSGLLAKCLGTEKKINNAMIAGVENSNDKSAKESIRSAAIAAGIQPKLHARVKSLT